MKICLGTVCWGGYLERYINIFVDNYITLFKKLIGLNISWENIPDPKIVYVQGEDIPGFNTEAAIIKLKKATGKDLKLICDKHKYTVDTIMYSTRNRLRNEFRKDFPDEEKVYFYFPIDDRIRPEAAFELIKLARAKTPSACMFKFFVDQGGNNFIAGTRPICSYKDIHPGDWGGYCAYNILKEDENYEDLKGFKQIYIPLKYFSDTKYERALRTLSVRFDAYIYLPPIIKANYKNLLINIIDKSIDTYPIKGFVISNLSNFAYTEKLKKKYGGKFKFIGNYTLNVFNIQTENELKNIGIDEKFTISPELDRQTIESLISNSSSRHELIIYGRTPLMYMNYCLLGKTNKCYPTCGVHCKDEKQYYLKDRLGLNFRILPDNMQTVTTVYNSKITSIDGSEFKVSSYRVDILDENVEQINSIIENISAGKRFEGKEYTNGNLNREI